MSDEKWEEYERLLREKERDELKLQTLKYELWIRYLREYGFNITEVERSGLPGA